MTFHVQFKSSIKFFGVYFLNCERLIRRFERLLETAAFKKEEIHISSLESINKQLSSAIHLLLFTGVNLDNSRQRIMQLYCLFSYILRFANFIFIAHFVKFFFRLNSMLLTFHAFNACVMASFITMTLKRRNIIQSLKTVSRLAPTSTSKKWKKWFMLMMAIHYIGILLVVASMAWVVNNMDILDDIPSTINFCGWTFRDRQREVLLAFVKFSIIFNAFSIVSTCSAQTILCSTSYYYLSEAVAEFGHILKRRFESGLFHQGFVEDNMVRFKKTVVMVREMNNAFSNCMLFLYGAAVMCIFNALSVALNMNKGNFTLYIFASTMFFGVTYGFLFLTYFGSRITSKFHDLCDILNDCSGLMACNSVSDLCYFSILAGNIRTSDMHLTGGNMFVIRRDMILSVAGVMITYGILIFQLDNMQ